MSDPYPSNVTRRDLLRLAAFTSLTTGLLCYVDSSHASVQNACNPGPCPLPDFPKQRPATPSEALQALKDGNYRWSTFKTDHPDQCQDYLQNCSPLPQKPFAALLSCVDSRVPPELLFDVGMGDLFVARVAGNSVVPILEDSLRYGTENLGALVLLVLGHSDCGAVKAAVQYYLEQIGGSDSDPDLSGQSESESQSWEQDIGEGSLFGRPEFAFIPPILPAVRVARKIVRKNGGDPNDPSQVTPVAINQHVILTVQKLSSRDPFRRLINHNKLLVKGGVYDLTSLVVTIPPPPEG